MYHSTFLTKYSSGNPFKVLKRLGTLSPAKYGFELELFETFEKFDFLAIFRPIVGFGRKSALEPYTARLAQAAECLPPNVPLHFSRKILLWQPFQSSEKVGDPLHRKKFERDTAYVKGKKKNFGTLFKGWWFGAKSVLKMMKSDQ